MYKIYTIKKGDTLTSLAKQFNTTVDNLMNINSYEPVEPLIENQKIIVPNNSRELFEVYKIKPGDTMYSIAKMTNSNLDDLLNLNGLKEGEYIYPNEEILIPSKGTKFLITKDGDTVSSVVEELGTNELQLRLQNDAIYLRPEQLLVYKKEEL